MLVFIVLVSFQVFVIVRILPGKEKKTAFPFGMLTKLLVVNFRMSAAAYYIERERGGGRGGEHSSTRKAHSFDIRPDCTGGVSPVSEGHTA
jgi:hypothetical protein